MPESTKTAILTPATVLAGESPLVLVARLEPVANLDRFQPAGFPEVGHVVYKAPRNKDGQPWEENVCIVDSAASMANHLESVCIRGPHDYELVAELTGMPYVRCVTGDLENGKLPLEKREPVVTSLTEGHRIASTYFLDGEKLDAAGNLSNGRFGDELAGPNAFGIQPSPASKKAHPPADKWWDVFSTIFRYDPNSLVHGVLFPQWQIKISRFLTAHLEAFGAGRVDRAGVKFDRLGMTSSGQPIFAVDDATAREIRATFILDVALLRSFGRKSGEKELGLNDKQKEFLIGLALWKIQRLLEKPFRFRSGCHLRCMNLKQEDREVEIAVDIEQAIQEAGFALDPPRITDIYWKREELYREEKEKPKANDAVEEGSASDQEDAES